MEPVICRENQQLSRPKEFTRQEMLVLSHGRINTVIEYRCSKVNQVAGLVSPKYIINMCQLTHEKYQSQLCYYYPEACREEGEEVVVPGIHQMYVLYGNGHPIRIAR